jgi:alpha-mannosidase
MQTAGCRHGARPRFDTSAKLLLLATVCFLAGAITQVRAAAARVSHLQTGGYTIYAVPHSHIDVEWFWTYEQTKATAIRILTQALRMLKRDPRFAFTQDQVQLLKPFWDSLSDDDREVLKKMIRNGRFEVATGTWNQPDVNGLGFESLTRQFLVGEAWIRATLGARVVTAWNIDTFGQTLQMPQLYRLAGLRYAFFSRDIPPEMAATAKSLFYWRSPDGSQILARIAPYYVSGPLRRAEEAGFAMLKEIMERNPAGNDRIMLPWGADSTMPTETSQEIEADIRKAATRLGIPVKAVLVSTASRYFQDVADGGVQLPTYANEFNPPLKAMDLRGMWGQRPAEKLLSRRVEEDLESSEKLSSIMSLHGLPYPRSSLAWAWERVLDNQNHDTSSGVHIDTVGRVAVSRYMGALEVGRQLQSDSLYGLSRMIDTHAGGNLDLLVFNALSFSRTELVQHVVTFTPEQFTNGLQVTNFRIIDPAGKAVPFRVIALSRFNSISDEISANNKGAGPITTAEIEFVATAMPPLGYRVYRIEPLAGDLQVPVWRTASAQEISSKYFQLRIDAASGSIAQLRDRRSGREVLSASRYGGNEIVLEEEKNPGMEGELHLTGREIRAAASRPDAITMRTDELGTTVRIEGPFEGGKRIQEIELYEQLARVDFKTDLRGFPGHDGMVTVVLPVNHPPGARAVYESSDAVVERPDGIYPAQSWVDLPDGDAGVAILNRGTIGHQIAANEARLILLRSFTNFPAYRAPEASEAGDHVFRYSIFPHSGDWRASAVAEQAHSVNSPLRVLPTDAHDGTLPLEHSFLSVSSGAFEVTAFKEAEDGSGYILRGHETKGLAGRVWLRLGLPLERAWLSDLYEETGPQMTGSGGELEFDCKPFEFTTLRLKLIPDGRM